MRRNSVKHALEEGKTVVGTMITEFRTPEVVRMIAAVGFDFVFIDTEHSQFTLETVVDMIRAAKSTNLTCLVRVPDLEYHLIARTLDAGAEGILIPRVETKEEVEALVKYAKYPPWGERGFGARSIITDYESVSVKERVQILNEESMIVIQIESKEAINNIDALLSVKGVDAALIGPNDLSISLGIPGEFSNPLQVQYILKMVEKCERYGIASGIHFRDLKTLLYWKDHGMRLLTFSTDANLLLSAAKEAVSEIRKYL